MTRITLHVRGSWYEELRGYVARCCDLLHHHLKLPSFFQHRRFAFIPGHPSAVGFVKGSAVQLCFYGSYESRVSLPALLYKSADFFVFRDLLPLLLDFVGPLAR